MSRKEPAAPLSLSCEALPAEFETRRPWKNHTAIFSRNSLIKTLRASPMDAQLHSLLFFSPVGHGKLGTVLAMHTGWGRICPACKAPLIPGEQLGLALVLE